MAEKNREFKLVGVGSASSQEKIEKPALSFMQDAWRRLKKNKLAVVSMWFLAILIVFSMISVVLVPRDDANAFNTKEVTTYRNLPPKLAIIFHSGMGQLLILGVQKQQMFMLIKVYQKEQNSF